MQVEVKTSPSPVPDQRRDAEWKLSYRKIASTGVWSLHVSFHISDMGYFVLWGFCTVRNSKVLCQYSIVLEVTSHTHHE